MNRETPTHVISAALGTLWTLYPSRNWKYILDPGSGTGVGTVLAATWALIKGVKKALDPNETRWPEAAIIQPEGYIHRYINLVRTRFQDNEQRFIDLFEFGKLHGSMTLCCYCPDGQFCHRHTAVFEVVFPLAEHYRIDLTRGDLK